jgi:hypothetical protein
MERKYLKAYVGICMGIGRGISVAYITVTVVNVMIRTNELHDEFNEEENAADSCTDKEKNLEAIQTLEKGTHRIPSSL